jgi:drug/metabolite transporter (DMT)-like permease
LSTETQTQPAAAAQTEAQAATPAAVQGFTIYDAALLGMVLTWAANPAALKWALQYMDPLAFNALRFLLATTLPLGLALLGRERLGWQRGDGWKILFLGVMGHGVYQAVFIVGLSQTLAGNVALILSVNPAFVAVFSALFGYERIRPYQWAGIGLTLAGVGLVVLGTGNPLELGSRLLGDLLIVGITIMWAFYTVMSGPLLKRYSAVKLNALTMPVGSVVLLLIASPSLAAAAPTFPEVPPLAWLVLALSGLLAVSLSYIVWYRGLQVLGATRTAVYANLVPVLAALIAFFVAREPLGLTFWTGMAIVLLGVSLTRFGDRLVRA